MAEEQQRLDEAHAKGIPWKKWGPYLSERQWGTVREDYSADGNAWDYFSHDQARSRAYRWGEDGLAGISDDQQLLCFALALWNGNDPILKERLFGLTNSEGNHGEDVKEYYFYLDSTPTHSYMKYLYKYPQAAYPYNDIVQTNRQLGRYKPEYELLDTGVFAESRYFDVLVEYAKQTPEDLLVTMSVTNRGPEQASLHLLPTIWFRNTWSGVDDAPRPRLSQTSVGALPTVVAEHSTLGRRYLYCAAPVGGQPPLLLFTENETNSERLFARPNRTPYVKDGIGNAIVHGKADAVNPECVGTKAAAHYQLSVAPGATVTITLRLSDVAPDMLSQAYLGGDPVGEQVARLLATRRSEADAFYATIIAPGLSDDAKNVVRQALAGMLWSKQFYFYNVSEWLQGQSDTPNVADRLHNRNRQWRHLYNADIISMPDKWEYPWYAAWDLAFHCIVLFIVDPDFAKHQLDLMLQQTYLHPNGQIPAYEWNFGDVNPPVHAWAVYYIYTNEKQLCGSGDVDFLKRSFHKLLMNFTWWVNRKDEAGNNVFEGGFLGLDNIGVFDRSSPLPTGGYLEQADGTAWMAFYCQMMLQIALELALEDPVYEDLACKFFEHFLWIVAAMDQIGERQDELWDAEDGFFYDVLRLPDGRTQRLKVRSMVGLLALCATTVIDHTIDERLPGFMERVRWFNEQRPELTANIRSFGTPGVAGRRILSILDAPKLRRVLERMLDEQEFLSPYGIRALSRHYKDHPYTFYLDRYSYRVDYEPAESTSGMFGGNSNWRGPIWMPVNILLIRALILLHAYYGDEFTVECPTGSGQQRNLWQVSETIAQRLSAIFLRDTNGQRPVYAHYDTFQNDPHWRDLILFYEYFNGDTGMGLGASHQTGWTGLIVPLMQLYGSAIADTVQAEVAHA